MSLQINQSTTVSTTLTTTSKTEVTSTAASIGAGGCLPPRPPGDLFDTRVPPRGGCFPPPPIDIGDAFYKWRLRGMSDEQLQGEKFHQQLNLLLCEFTGDERGAAEAREKLGAIQAEEMRRAFGGIGHDLEMAFYKHKLHGMSDSQLAAEERKQQMAYLFARLTGNEAGAQAAQEKLNAINHEQLLRSIHWWRPSLPVQPYARAQ